jgi:Kef-type K+ transport system membrane component KefB
MTALLDALAALGWPAALAVAWVVGEVVHRLTGAPRISVYGIVGFALGPTQLGWLPPADSGHAMLAANLAFGLVLFEFGYRINWRWLRANPWIATTGLLESGATFAVVLGACIAWGLPAFTSVLMASLAMSTSPATVLRVINEERGAGQVTERILHLTALNCVLSVLVFKVAVGVWMFLNTGSVVQAAWGTSLVLVASIAMGVVAGVGVSSLLRLMGPPSRDASVPFALTVALLVTAAHVLKLSPILATLAFGFAARHRRVVFSQAQRNFGPLGDVTTLLLFVFVASTLEWQRVQDGAAFAVILLLLRGLTKIAGSTLLARRSGVTLRKGLLTGLGLSPISVFAILVLEHARYLGIDIIDQLAPLAALTLLLELAGPALTRFALVRAGETADATQA